MHFFLAKSRVLVPFSWPFFGRIEWNLPCIIIELYYSKNVQKEISLIKHSDFLFIQQNLKFL